MSEPRDVERSAGRQRDTVDSMNEVAHGKSARVRVRSGRLLGYAEHGDPRGRPMFFFHGSPGSRVSFRPEDVQAAKGFRLIAIDRPGYGLSDYQHGRRMLDFPDDVSQLADALGLERFSIAGVSGGGPYVAACAWALPARVRGAAIVGGMGPIDARGDERAMMPTRRLALNFARAFPWLVPPVARLDAFRFASSVRRDAAAFLDEAATQLPPSDRALVTQASSRAMLLENYVEAFRQGSRGYATDLSIVARPWGFRLEEVRVQVHLWHGEADSITPLYLGQHVARALPNCKARFLPGEGHFLRLAHWPEIFAALAESW